MSYKDIFLSTKTTEAIKHASMPVERIESPLFGMDVRVIEDPEERQREAVLLSLITGRPVLYEGADGKLLEVSMPKPYADNPFPDSPIQFAREA